MGFRRGIIGVVDVDVDLGVGVASQSLRVRRQKAENTRLGLLVDSNASATSMAKTSGYGRGSINNISADIRGVIDSNSGSLLLLATSRGDGSRMRK